MKRYLLINLIALAMVCVFCSNEVDAFRPAQLIAEIGSSDGQNEANAPATHTGYVETNRPFHGVTWYVNGDHNYSTLGSNYQDTSYLNLSDLDGEVWGRPYSIKAEVWCSDVPGSPYANSNLWDTEWYVFRVYKPEVDNGIGTNTGVWGESRMSSMTWDSNSEVLTTSNSVYVWNPTEVEVEVYYKFLLEVTNVFGGVLYREIDEPKDGRNIRRIKLPAGEVFDYSNSLSIDLSGEMRSLVGVDASNYLEVSGNVRDHWKVETHPAVKLNR